MGHSPIHSHTHTAPYTGLFVLIIHTHLYTDGCIGRHFDMWPLESHHRLSDWQATPLPPELQPPLNRDEHKQSEAEWMEGGMNE